MRFNPVHLWAILGSTLLIRLLSLGAYPLMDTTEARYGEMARLMIETQNWVTPQFDYGVPFWGKPPLFTWMSAGGIEAFGVNEFAVRFPHWLAGIVVMLLMANFARSQKLSGLVTALVLATCGIFAIAAGAVMTDMALTLGMTLAMVGFFRCWQGSRGWGYVGFIGLAIGLLAKGPLVLVLMGLAVVPWVLVSHGLFQGVALFVKRVPWLGGSLLMLAIALPWYLLAEQRTPGFLDYFIIGEHIKRFLVSGWQGDLYGTAHDEVRGTIWLFWLYSAAPWSLVLPALLWRKRKALRGLLQEDQGVLSFALWWLISPMVLFSLSGNILPAYVLPGIPALGIAIAKLTEDIKPDAKWFKVTASVVPVLLVIAVFILHLGVAEKRSDKRILAHADRQIATFYIGKRPFSGQFYSSGQAKVLTDVNEIDRRNAVQLIGHPNEVEPIIADLHLSCIVEMTAKSQRTLYKCSEPT